MNDQNQNNQPLDQVASSGPLPSSLPVAPSLPVEDITPVTDIPITPPVAEPVVPPQVETTSFASSYSAPTPTPEPVTFPSTPEPTYVPPQAAPINTVTLEVPIVLTPTLAEPAMPEIKAKKKISPIIGGLVALLFVAGVAGAAFYVSNQLSTRQAVAPNAPESKPLAGCTTGSCPSNNPCYSPGCSCGQAFCGGCINGCRYIDTQSCNQLIASECSGGGGGGGGGDVSCPSIPNTGDSGPSGSSCNSSNCGGSSCGVYTYKCGTLCYQASCGAHDCGTEGGTPLTCDSSKRDTPNSKTITFAKTGKVIPFIRGGYTGTLTLTKTGSTINIPFNGQNPGELISFNVNAGDVYTVGVRINGETQDSYGWIPNKSTNICGPVKAPGASIDGNSKATGLCGPEVDITTVRNLAIAKTDLTDITAGGVNATIQCWGDAEVGDATTDYDYDDFTLVFGYEKVCVPTGTIKCDPDCSTTCGTAASNITCKDSCGNDTTKSCPKTAECTCVPSGVVTCVPDCPTVCGTAASTITTCTDSKCGATTKSCLATEACPLGACTQVNVYKKGVDGVYGTTPLTHAQLIALTVGDVLRLSWVGSTDNLQGRVRATVSTTPTNSTVGDWLPGQLDATNKKLFTYDGYQITVAGTYNFEAQVSTTAQ